jgi:serpin B
MREFALALHRLLGGGGAPQRGAGGELQPAGGNLCWSPYSVAAALGLVAAGARGRTRDELAAALAPGGDLATLDRVLADSASPTDAEAAVANRLWLDLHLRCREEFQQAALRMPGGAVYPADFRSDPEGSRIKINEDVEQVTRGLIRDLIGEGMISPETAAVIVNALYLKVGWLNAFAEAATAPARFQAPSGAREVPTMRQQESFGYASAGGWRMVSLPTAGTVVVDVLLPDEPDEPGEPGAALTPELLTALQRATRPTKVDLTMPRFRVEAAAVLNGPLEQLGVVAAFSPAAADFSGISETERTFIDLVVHKAVLRVDEQGFEGAAATAVVMRMVSMDMSSPVPFHVDRPFLVQVRHPRTGAIYFLAHVAEP